MRWTKKRGFALFFSTTLARDDNAKSKELGEIDRKRSTRGYFAVH
jgi:hypothetical protein